MHLLEHQLPDFFTERVEEAMCNQEIALSETTAGYLTGMLVRLARSQEVFDESGPVVLADLHLQARTSDRRQAARLYQKLGDTALFISGYFSESLERSAVGLRYYTDMGGSAYHQVAGITSRGGAALAGMFQELAHRFEDCVSLIAEVADRDRQDSDQDLLRLYELWLTTRSPHAAKRLARLGLPLMGSGSA
jgi:hypothetical protein